VDQNRFDHLTRHIGEQTDRRSMFKTAAAGTLALLGVGAFGRAALGQDVGAESQGFKGDSCDENKDCRKGLICNDAGRCEYKKNCGGKKGDACKNNGQCCSNKNLKCQNRKCKRNK
jgi:hypothetical protein